MRKPGRRNLRGQLCEGIQQRTDPTEPRFAVWIPAERSFGWEWKSGGGQTGNESKATSLPGQEGTWNSSLLSTWLMSKLLAGSGKGAPMIYLIPTKLPPWALHTFFEPGLCWAALGGKDSWEKSFFFFFFYFNSDIFLGVVILAH